MKDALLKHADTIHYTICAILMLGFMVMWLYGDPATWFTVIAFGSLCGGLGSHVTAKAWKGIVNDYKKHSDEQHELIQSLINGCDELVEQRGELIEHCRALHARLGEDPEQNLPHQRNLQ